MHTQRTVATEGIEEQLPSHDPANENDPPFIAANYWQDRAAHQEEAGLVIEFEKMKLAIEEHGGSKAFFGFDEWESDQIHSSHAYLGLQTEMYVVLDGTAEIWVKHYWESSKSWCRRVLNHGDIVIVNPQTCHFFKWRSPQGVAVVTKSPNTIGGVGRPPASKLNCTNCPRFQKGCDGLTAA